MTRPSIWLRAVVCAALLLVACRMAPVYNVYDTPVAVAKPVALEDVENALIRAAASQGWQLRKIKSGQALGTYYSGSDMAEVKITYSRFKYAIRYQNSENLSYDGVRIHRHYNAWVEDLNSAIKEELQAH